MTAIFLLGFLAFIFSIIYLAIHFVRKFKDKSRPLSKKIFYPTFIGGLLFLIIGGSFMDTGTQAKLDEQLVKNEKLVVENKGLKSTNIKLQKENGILIKDKKKLSSQIDDFEKSNQELKDQHAALQTEKDDLNKNVSELTTKNTDLQNEVNSLNTQLASKSTASSVNANTTSTSTTSGSYEAFANCTDLRTKYPNGVPEGHPAYVPSMDRDKDGYACER